MIKIENTEVYGWEAAFRGMRNPMNSWAKSDSGHGCAYCDDCTFPITHDPACDGYHVGQKDLELAKRLADAGTDHGKFLRMITVTCDITAPLYYYKELDTYKVGTVCNSCSTMHRLAEKEFTADDFSMEHLIDLHGDKLEFLDCAKTQMETTIEILNNLRILYLRFDELTSDGRRVCADIQDLNPGITKKDIWRQMVQLLPSSYNQRRTYQFNYAVLKNIYHARRNHKLNEWHDFCSWIESLPYSVLITGRENEKEMLDRFFNDDEEDY